MIGKFYITTIKDLPTAPGIERIRYIFNNNVYGFGDGAPGLSNLNKYDKICFYLKSEKRVALYGTVSAEKRPGYPPEEWEINDVDGYLDYYDVEVELKDVHYVSPPIKIREVREKLGWPKNWGVHVISTRSISENEFNILTDQI